MALKPLLKRTPKPLDRGVSEQPKMEFPANGPAPALRGLLIFNAENLAPPRVTSLVSTAVLRRSGQSLRAELIKDQRTLAHGQGP